MNNLENETNNNRERPNRWIYPTCCEIFQKNQSQLHSALGSLILLTASGLHIGWGLWRVIYSEPWIENLDENIFILILTSWYIMAIVGSILAALMVPHFKHLCTKLVFIMLSISGLAFIAFFRYYPAIICGRSLAGLAHGIIYTTAITNAAENASPQFRCQLMSLFNYAIVIGIFITMLMFANTNTNTETATDTSGDQLIGIATIVILVIGFIVTIIMNYSSIPFLLRNNCDDESIAINVMKRLRTEQPQNMDIGVLPSELRNQFDEFKLMISEESNESINIFESNNLKPLLLIIITRILSFLSSNIMINAQMIILGHRIFHIEDHQFIATKLMFISMKLFASLGVLFLINRIGHLKQLTIFGTIGSTIILIYSALSFAIQIEQLANWLPAIAFMIYQIMVTFGIDSLQHCLLIDAFSSTKKASISIAFVTTFEYLLHILIIVIFVMAMDITEMDNSYAVIMGTALTSLVMHLILEYYLPETNGLTLYRARQQFRDQF